MHRRMQRVFALQSEWSQAYAMAPDREGDVVITDKQLEANHQNALRSTGPKTMEGVEAVKFNALRHGLRSVQSVVPGENLDAWEAHRAGIVADLRPLGAVELALAEQVAMKLWRLGRVVCFEADVIGNAQDCGWSR
jgi:hypothetical protein